MTRRRHRVAVLAHVGRPGLRRVMADALRRLARRRVDVRLETALGRELGRPGAPLAAVAAWCDTLVTLGGDGTALAGARAMAGRRGRLLAVNLGGLGFLTVAEAAELDHALGETLQGSWPTMWRPLITGTLRRGARTLRRALAVNDVVLKGAGGYAAVHLRMEALGGDLGHMVADGLIAASAAGSTAYALSAGGPVLAPDLEALVVTPVCAHSLGNRALVLPAGEEVRARLLRSFDPALLLFDGHDRVPVEVGDEVRVRLGKPYVRFAANPDRPFARALQAKLGWQGSRQRSL